MKNGLIIINKGEDISSQGVVSRVKRLLGLDKAGHTGTLDPLATGVLPVLCGRGVKASEYMLTSDKHYRATLLLGITTDTEDITGKILTKSEKKVTPDEVFDAIKSMVGVSRQTPPMYSALKVSGKKLCDLARAGITVERQSREITIHKIESKYINENEYEIDVVCSKGTYIRTLCADIGKKLGTGGVMKTLCRCEASGFALSDACTIEELEAMNESEREKKILPIETVFANLRRVELSPFFERLARCGVEIYLNKISLDAHLSERVTLWGSGKFFALGEVREFEAGLAIKPIKQFEV